ncbi:hypothetical protein E4T47_03711 [Aureobasidium subglaciale]|nr:hypothetical protein E4T47_03711 [Aureobasidium subglaciale]
MQPRHSPNMNHDLHFSRQDGDPDQNWENETMPGTRCIAIKISVIVNQCLTPAQLDQIHFLVSNVELRRTSILDA